MCIEMSEMKNINFVSINMILSKNYRKITVLIILLLFIIISYIIISILSDD
jgi:hypothetical protein